MLKRILIIIMVTIASGLFINGCKEDSDVKTKAEYEAEAKEQITEENMDEELAKLEQEVNQDVEQEK